MQLDIFVVFTNLLALFLLIAVGFIIAKLKWIPQEGSSIFSSLLVKVTLPCTIFVSLASREYDPNFIKDVLITLAIGMVVFPGMHLLGKICAKALGVKRGKRGIWEFTAAYSNNGFMGFPITLTLFGEDGLAIAVIYNICFNIFAYTIGAMSVMGDSQEEGHKLDIKSVIFTNINYAIVLSLIVYFARIPVPEVILTPMTHLSNITTPISMVIIGMVLSRSNALEMIRDKDAWTATFFRLLASPFILIFIFRFLPIHNPLIPSVVITLMSMPVAAVCTVLAETYHGNIDMAAKVSFLTNILSLITIPFISMFL